MSVDHKYFLNKQNKGIVYAGTFLLVTIIASLGLFGVNTYISNENDKRDNELKQVEDSITEIKKDKKLQVKELLDLNSNVLAELKRKSKITEYINHAKMINSEYGIKLDGFSYGAGKIAMNTTIESDDRGFAYGKMVNYIRNYRKSESAKFKLLFVNSISGQDRITFTSNFEVK